MTWTQQGGHTGTQTETGRFPIADSGLGRASKPKNLHLKRSPHVDKDQMVKRESIPLKEIEDAFRSYPEKGCCPNSAQKLDRKLAKKDFKGKITSYRTGIKTNMSYSPERLFFIRQLACLLYTEEQGLRNDTGAFSTGKILKMAGLPNGTIPKEKDAETTLRNGAVDELLKLRKSILG